MSIQKNNIVLHIHTIHSPLLDFTIQCGTTIELKWKTFYSNLYLKFPLMIEDKHMECTTRVVQKKSSTK